MGLFSGDVIMTMGTQVSRVIPDESLPNANQQGMLRSLFGEGDMVEQILDAMVSSIGTRAERMYRYAEAHYVHGLPTGVVRTGTQGRSAVEAVLSALEGTAVSLDYVHFGPANRLHMGWMQLIALYGYDPETNQLPVLTASKGATVYLDDMQLVLSDDLSQFPAGSLDQWGIAPVAGYTPRKPQYASESVRKYVKHTPPAAIEGTVTPYMKVTYTWFSAIDGGYVLETVNMALPVLDATLDYFHAHYSVAGHSKYWMYQAGAGTYPTLDAVFDHGSDVMGRYFPFMYFRYAGVAENAVPTSTSYLQNKKMAKMLGMDFDQVSDAINGNPDINQVDAAYMMFGVSPESTNAVEQKYLFDFFAQMYDAEGSNLSSLTQAQIAGNLDPLLGANFNRNTIIIQDGRSKMALSTYGIYRRRVTGVIGAIGEHSSVMGSVDLPVSVTQVGVSGDVTETVMKATKTYTYRRQVNVAQYDEIEVVGLQMLYYIYGQYHVTTDTTKDILLVPIDRQISENYTTKEREKLYARGLHFVFNALVFTKLAWYQSDFFQLVIIGVSIAMVFYSFAEGLQALAAAIETGSTAAVLAVVITFIERIVVGLVIKYALKLFVKAVGAEAAFVLAVLAAAYGVYDAFESGSLAGAPWAKDLLQLSSGLTNAIGKTIQDEIGDLMGDWNAFQRQAEEQTKTLEASEKLLENHSLLSPFVIFGEKPDDFYNRTVHSGNIGAMSIAAISSYVDFSLSLPTVDQTLGDLQYGL